MAGQDGGWQAGMMREYPDYYEQFHCIADRCPDTCCAGWEVDLDDEAWYRYLVVKGPFGQKLRANMKEDGEWKYFPLNERGRCPFLTGQNLCEIYQELGEDALCQTCAEHPRYFIDCGDYEQVDLSLGCPEVARIFFSSREPIRYVRREEEPDEGRDIEDVTDAADFVRDAAGADDIQDRQLDEAGEGGRAISEEDICDVDPAETFTEADRQRRDRILAQRNRILTILQDESQPKRLEERMRAAGIWQPVGDPEIMSLIRQMEPLNADWSRRVQQMEALIHREGYEDILQHMAEDRVGEERWNAWMLRLACYLVFRYWIDACFSGDTAPQVRLINRSLELVRLLYAVETMDVSGRDVSIFGDRTAGINMQRLIDVVHVFSRQVEFDDVNVDLMKKAR